MSISARILDEYRWTVMVGDELDSGGATGCADCNSWALMRCLFFP